MRDDVARAAAIRALEIAKSAKAQKGDRGEKGEPGEIKIVNYPIPGPQGERGIPGIKGEMGNTGYQGKPGTKGDPGPTGPTGSQGLKGDKGETGEPGRNGIKGERGFIGPIGPNGDIGPMPKHERKGLMLRFEDSPGVWGKWIVFPTSGGGGGGRDDKLFDRQAQLMEVGDLVRLKASNANKVIGSDGTNLVWSTPSVGQVTFTGTETLTNKRIDPRVTSAASASTLTPDISASDVYAYTALAAGLTINAPIGTPLDGDKLIFRLLDNGTSRALTWNATYTVIGVTLPTATTISKTTYVGCIYNANNTRWDVIAVTTQA